MAMDYASAFVEIIKKEKLEDGTMMVYGKATDDTLDLDQQICDPAWLDKAMPDWFKSGGNIREMHGNNAAGVAKEYERKNDGHYINTLIVDPLAIKKTDAGVYTGFSIGIKSPRVVRDTKAANGRIIDGQIIEVSLVDRPANPSAKLIMAKSVEGESTLVQVEEMHEYKAPLPSEIAKNIKTEKGSKMDKLKQIAEMAKSLTPDTAKFDKDAFDTARRALAGLIVVEATEMANDGSNEKDSIELLLDAVKHLFEWYEGEVAEGEVQAPMNGDLIELAADAEVAKNDSCDCEGCEDKCNKECKCMKSAEAEKTVEAEVPAETPAEEVAPEATPEISETPEVAEVTDVKAIVEEAVKSAMESVKAEIDSLKTAKDEAVEKSVKLEADLATALTKAVSGGPKRTAVKYSEEAKNDHLVKASSFKAKADATTDPVLRKGYFALYNDELQKAGIITEASENE